MPIIDLPDGREIEFPDGMGNDAIAAAIKANFPEFTPKGAKAAPARERTWGEAITDTTVQLGEGGTTIAGAIPNLFFPGSGLAEVINDAGEYWRGKQSDALKGRIAQADKAISAAGNNGMLAQAGEAAGQYWDDPGLAARFVTTNLPSMIPGLAVAKGAQVTALARGATAARAAAIATTAAGATNGVLNAGGARGEAYADIKRTLMAQGLTEEEAELAAISDSRLPAAVGGATGFISGKTGLEGALAGSAGRAGAGMLAGARRALAGTATELAGEQLEEVAPKLATNYQAGQYDGRDITKDVGRTAVETAIGSGPGAALSGAAAWRNAAAPIPAAPDAAPHSEPTIGDIGAASTLDEAIQAANAVVDAPARPLNMTEGIDLTADIPDPDAPLSGADAKVWLYGENKITGATTPTSPTGMLYNDPAQVTETLEIARAEKSQAARNAILDQVIATEGSADMSQKQLVRAFAGALQQSGFTQAMPNGDELQRIDRMTGVAAALAADEAPLPSSPNELVDAVPEKRAPVVAADPLGRIKQLMGSGYALQGKQLVKGDEKLNLSPAEIKHARQKNRVRTGTGWHAFPKESGTLGIPRADMPQIKAEHRGAMVQFLKGRGIAHEQVELNADDLKPTQAEFSIEKVDGAKQYQGGDRSILVSSDGHVVDGHHQWLAKADLGLPVKAIRLDSPIRDLLPIVREFPSSSTEDGNMGAQEAAAGGAPVATAGGSRSAPAAKDTRTGGQRSRDRLRTANPFLAFLAEQGVNPADRADTGVEKGRRGNPLMAGFGPIFRRTGKRIDELADAAREAGFLTQADIDSAEDNGGTNKLLDMIRRTLAQGEAIQTVGTEAGQSDVDQALLEEAERLGVDATQPLDAVYDAVAAEHAKREDAREEVGATSIDEQDDIENLADQFSDAEAAYLADLMLDPPLDAGQSFDNLTNEQIDAIFGLKTKAATSREAESDPAGEARQGTARSDAAPESGEAEGPVTASPPVKRSEKAPDPAPEADPETDLSDIPLAFQKKVTVPLDVWVADEGKYESMDFPANKAIASVREDITNLRALLRCLKG